MARVNRSTHRALVAKESAVAVFKTIPNYHDIDNNVDLGNIAAFFGSLLMLAC